jgi:glycosyltransferase involved in cell wall biosynthesis
LKVLHILNELKPSGGETMLKSAASQWCLNDDHSILSTGSEVGSYAQILRNSGYKVLHLPFSKNISFFQRFAALLKDGSYDIIHIHPERAAPLYALVAKLVTDAVIFRTVHHLFRFEGILRIRKMIERQTMKHLLGVKFLSNSPSGLRNEEKRYGMSNVYAPNWYDSNFFKPPSTDEARAARASLSWPDDLTVFVSLGGNWFYKNYDLIVHALAKVPECHRILYVQIGVQGEGAPLEALAKNLGVENRLFCAGIVDDVRTMLFAADAYLMPSSEEGFGIAAVEAMAVGLPAVLGNVEALTDFKETISGIRYVEPEISSITDALIECSLMGRNKLRSLGLQQAQKVEENYGNVVGAGIYYSEWLAALDASAQRG